MVENWKKKGEKNTVVEKKVGKICQLDARQTLQEAQNYEIIYICKW